MPYRKARSPMRRQRQRIAIGRSYACRWERGMHSDISTFCRMVNAELVATFDGQYDPDGVRVEINARRRTVLLHRGSRDWRATLSYQPEAIGSGKPIKPITPADIELFQTRQSPC